MPILTQKRCKNDTKKEKNIGKLKKANFNISKTVLRSWEVLQIKSKTIQNEEQQKL